MTDTFHRNFTELSQEQKSQMAVIKENADHLLNLMNQFVDPNERSERSRCMAIARTNLETTIMWAIKAVTTKEE